MHDGSIPHSCGGLHIVFGDGEDRNASGVFKEVAIALIQVTGGAVGGAAMENVRQQQVRGSNDENT